MLLQLSKDFSQFQLFLLSSFYPSQVKTRTQNLIKEKRIKHNFLGTWVVNVHADSFKNISVCDAR